MVAGANLVRDTMPTPGRAQPDRPKRTELEPLPLGLLFLAIHILMVAFILIIS